MDPNNRYQHACNHHVPNDLDPAILQEPQRQINRNAENQETDSESAHKLSESQSTAETQNNSERSDAGKKLSGNTWFCNPVNTVIVQSADVQLCEQIQRKSGYYPIKDFKKKGCALILSNAFEEHEIEKRRLPGYNKDKENMRKLCEGLGCNRVDVRTNEKAEEIKNIIRDFADDTKHSNPSFIIVVILSHGSKKKDKQVFEGSDDEPVEVDFVLDSFNNEKASHLQNIPKLFIFHFCSGVKAEPSIAAADGYSESSAASNMYQPTNILPVYSDQFVAYLTKDVYIALVEDNGSWFINAITNIFMRYAKDEHVADLFTMVNKAVKYKTRRLKSDPSIYKEMSVSVSSLTEKLYLYPGYRS